MEITENILKEKTKVFFDCEFTGLHAKTTLISIGFIADNNSYFYAELTDYDVNQVDNWLKENVMEKLILKDMEPNTLKVNGETIHFKGTKEVLKTHLGRWLNQHGPVEMWSDCLAYDWVLFNDIFGGAFKIPKNVYYIPFDICTLFKIKGIDPDISREDFVSSQTQYKKHNALGDASIIKQCYEKLILV